jgi:hypothetical protein
MQTTSRRTLLAGAAALPVLAVPAIAAALDKVDPVYEAIEQHCKARTAHYVKTPGETDDEAFERIDRTSGASEAALQNLLTTRPTTVAGCAAALRHVHDHIAEYEDTAGQLISNSYGDTHSAAAGFLLLIAAALAQNASVQS